MPTPSALPRLAALIGVAPDTRTLLALWLADHGWRLEDLASLTAPAQLLICEAPFPRTQAPAALPMLARRFPGVPVLLVSPTILAGTPRRGDVAQQLGVSAVLALPLSRDALLATVDELTRLSR